MVKKFQPWKLMGEGGEKKLFDGRCRWVGGVERDFKIHSREENGVGSEFLGGE